MSKNNKIVIFGEAFQVRLTASYLASELDKKKTTLIPVIIESKEENELDCDFSPFEKTLQPILTSKNDLAGIKALKIVDKKSSTKFEFNFSNYGQVSASISFQQAYQIAHPGGSNTVPFDKFLNKKKNSNGVIYNRLTSSSLLQSQLINSNIYTVITSGIEVESTQGIISKILTTEGESIEGDIFIDCSKESLIANEFQVSQKIPSKLIPAFKLKSIRTNDSSDNDSEIIIGEQEIDINTSNNKISILKNYIFQETLNDELNAHSITEPWTNNCIAIGNAYCHLPELLISNDRILEAQLKVLATLLPKNDIYARKHFTQKSQNIVSDAVDTVNLLLQKTQLNTQLTPKNIHRRRLFESSAASYKEEGSLLSESCWCALLRCSGIQPKGINAIASTRNPSDISKKVNALIGL